MSANTRAVIALYVFHVKHSPTVCAVERVEGTRNAVLFEAPMFAEQLVAPHRRKTLTVAPTSRACESCESMRRVSRTGAAPRRQTRKVRQEGQ